MVRPPPFQATPRQCPRCFLPVAVCICAEIPSLTCGCRVVVVRHWFEAWRATNTGRLVALALEGATLLDHGRPDHRLEATDLCLGPGTCLLYPQQGDGAPVWTGGRPSVLLVPDGSWAQARRMVRRLPGLSELPRLDLPADAAPPPARRIRKSPTPAARSTLEAVAGALALWEPPQTSEALYALYDRLAVHMERSRWGAPR